MMTSLPIGMVQIDTKWLDVNANLAKIEVIVGKHNTHCALIALPEMFNTGYVMDPHSLANYHQDYTISKLQLLASKFDTIFCGSIPYRIGDTFTNTFIFVSKDGIHSTYDKIHLFSPAGESKQYKRGIKTTIVHLPQMKVKPLICYDLRFPHVSYNTEGYDLLLYTANWPEPRITQWQSLLQARAIENQVYTIGVNRVGYDQNKYKYNGQSMAYNYKGDPLINLLHDEHMCIVSLELEDQSVYRKTLPFLSDYVPI